KSFLLLILNLKTKKRIKRIKMKRQRKKNLPMMKQKEKATKNRLNQQKNNFKKSVHCLMTIKRQHQKETMKKLEATWKKSKRNQTKCRNIKANAREYIYRPRH